MECRCPQSQPHSWHHNASPRMGMIMYRLPFYSVNKDSYWPSFIYYCNWRQGLSRVHEDVETSEEDLLPIELMSLCEEEEKLDVHTNRSKGRWSDAEARAGEGDERCLSSQVNRFEENPILLTFDLGLSTFRSKKKLCCVNDQIWGNLLWNCSDTWKVQLACRMEYVCPIFQNPTNLHPLLKKTFSKII